MAGAVDVLVIVEAGQMSRANPSSGSPARRRRLPLAHLLGECVAARDSRVARRRGRLGRTPRGVAWSSAPAATAGGVVVTMRGDDHHEAAIAVDVVKNLAPPDGRAVPYLTMRAFIVGGSNNGSTTSRGERAGGWGAVLAPELGFGIAQWSASRRVYVAPEVRIGALDLSAGDARGALRLSGFGWVLLPRQRSQDLNVPAAVATRGLEKASRVARERQHRGSRCDGAAGVVVRGHGID